MSFCTIPRNAMNNAVMAPITSTTDRAVSDNSYNGDMRATMKMPAVTMVAAWIRAEMGVGPSMESGSHTCRGTCADLPMAPTNNRMQIRDMIFQSTPGTICTTCDARCGAMLNTAA